MSLSKRQKDFNNLLSFLTGEHYVTVSVTFFFNLDYEATSLWNLSLLSISESLVIYSGVLPGLQSMTDRWKGNEKKKKKPKHDTIL